MKRTEFLQETREMRSEEAYEGCKSECLPHAKQLYCLMHEIVHFGVIEANNDEGGLDELMDKRLDSGLA